jgi:hypothetical protein
MANYIVSGKQLAISIAIIAIFVTTCAGVGIVFLNYLELPEVFQDLEGKCLRVINYKNGDGYVCQDKDVTLRKYKTVVAKP